MWLAELSMMLQFHQKKHNYSADMPPWNNAFFEFIKNQLTIANFLHKKVWEFPQVLLEVDTYNLPSISTHPGEWICEDDTKLHSLLQYQLLLN